MRALSVQYPYARQILLGEKTEEYRTWQVAYRGPLVICTSGRISADAAEDMRGVPTPDPSELGVTFALVDLVDIYPDDNGEFTWLLKNPRPLVRNKIRGAVGIYHLPDKLVTVADGIGAVLPAAPSKESRIQRAAEIQAAKHGVASYRAALQAECDRLDREHQHRKSQAR